MFHFNHFENYLWSTGESTSGITVGTTGMYKITVTDIFGYESSDSLQVTYPEIGQINDTTLCLGDSLLWDAGLGVDYDYLWQDGSTDSSIWIKEADSYHIKVTDSFGYYVTSDTITIEIDTFSLQVSLGNDTILCEGGQISLSEGDELAETYLWSDNSTDSLLTITEGNDY